MNLLAAANYDPAVAVSKATTSLIAMTAFDTTNLRLAFTIPSHGMVTVKMTCVHHGSTTTAQVLLGCLEGATVRGRAPVTSNLLGTAVATTRTKLEASFTLTGLTPGAVNWDAAYGVEIVASANGAIKYGGPNNTTTDDAFGGFNFEIWDPQPQTTTAQLIIDSSGRAAADMRAISTDATAADNAESFFDGTGYAGTNNVMPTTTTVTNMVTANVTQISGDSAAADNLESYTDGTTPMPVNATQISGDATAADNAEAFFDGTGYAGTNNVIPTVTTTTNVTTVNGLAANVITAASIATGAIDADAIADGAIDAATFAAGAINNAAMSIDGSELTAIPWNAAWDAEVQSEVQDALEANNLDHLVKIAVDTDFATTVHLNSVIGHLADNGTAATFDRTTDSLEALQAEHDVTQGKIDTVDDFLDTEVAAILADTNELQTDWTDGGRLDLLIDAIKAKTDNLPADPADESNILAAIAGVQSDTNDIQTRLPAALSGDGFIKADLKSIDDETTDGSNATLNLKKLRIVNNSGTAIYAESTGGNGAGMQLIGASTSHGLNINGGAGGSGINVIGGTGAGGHAISVYHPGNGTGIDISADNGVAVNIFSSIAEGLFIEGTTNGLTVYGDGGDAVQLNATGGKSINAPQDIALPSGDLDDQLQAIDNAVDTEVAAIKMETDKIASIKAKTDSLTFTNANQVDANVQAINDTNVTGNGSSQPWGPA